MNLDMIIFWGVIIFFGLITVIGGSLFWIFWNRRKLIFTNFLSDTGQWERKSWKPDNIQKTFVYDNETYNYDIKLCTRDRINRPIAHYYKGNPKQQIFEYAKQNKPIVINNQEITAKDFTVLMLSKVLRDIFQDDEVMNMLMMILIITAVIGVTNIILIVTHNPDVTLANNNQTINIISEGVKNAIAQKPV
jgi:hypothetical protein